MFRTLGAALAMLLAAASAVHAQTRYVVGVENIAYMPYYAYEDGRYGGFVRAVLDAFAADRGYAFEYRPLPIQRLYARFLDGTVDFKFPDAPEWRQELRAGHEIAYSAPVADYVDGTIVPAGKPAAKDEIRTLGTVAGFTPWAWADDLGSGGAVLSENGSFEALLAQVLNGRVDAAYANVAVVRHQLDRLGRPGALVFAPDLPHVRGAYHLSTTKHPDVIAEFDAWLAANAGRVAEIRRRFGIDGEE
ncbi:transporter substrate-binding domain-containing protein [Arenibaculum sp.]|uniref:substrate-binding periplasmic protein n=1 Tax=Arenibaculum sp. TaxID=2865862 RepID=UPI002E146AD6|nr:transporter substrate-binding domain-containing protein [Arenibaculum sp.]